MQKKNKYLNIIYTYIFIFFVYYLLYYIMYMYIIIKYYKYMLCRFEKKNLRKNFGEVNK